MSTIAQNYFDAEITLKEGWEILVKNLGLQKATHFVVSLERGKGDSVKEIAEYWGDATIEEIHERVVAWKAKQVA
jgi:hypothetical protein